MAEKSKIEILLDELRNMKYENNGKDIANSKEVWSKIGAEDWEGAGFSSIEEMQQFIIANPYSNI